MADVGSLLVLGGTSWLGGRVVERAVGSGFAVTCLARGESGSAPPGATWLRADRWQPSAYGAVRRDWDAVLEVSWQPELVRGAVAALGDRARHWVYVSSCSVYADDTTPGSDESATRHPPWAATGVAGIDDYGPAKVACEDAVLAGTASRTIVRPGLIAGYGDRSDRFGYWPARFARVAAAGEPVLVPRLDTACQVIDVDDLAGWLVDCARQRREGAFNAVGDPHPLGTVLEACAAAAGAEPALRSAEDDWLVEHGVQPWAGDDSLPLWLPAAAYAGFMSRSNRAARTAGLPLRPVLATAESALRWETEQGLGRSRRAGLTTERERLLLTRLEADGARPAGTPGA